MDEGYYKPQMDELCTGMILQIQNIENAQWGQYVITNNDRPSDFNAGGDLQDDRVRVKYLDREDIESFGWRLIEENKNLDRDIFAQVTKYRGFNGKFSVFYVYHTCGLLVSNDDGGPLFAGRIRNKSEFQRIMEQIGLIAK